MNELRRISEYMGFRSQEIIITCNVDGIITLEEEMEVHTGRNITC